jgi:hypothetical protein
VTVVDVGEELELPPTLGPQVVQWMEERLVHGQGPVRGLPYRPTLEHKALIYAAYEVYPQGHELAGRRQHQDIVYSRAKGTAKTEMAGAVGAAELGPDGEAPVRCDGFDAHGQPVGVPVIDPDIPFLATTQTQAKDLAYTRARQMMAEGPLSEFVDAGVEETFNTRRDGKLYVVTAKAGSKDGYLPTFTSVDEPHLFRSAELHELVRVVYEGFPKTLAFDPWGLKTSTVFQPGEGSVLEKDFELWRQIQAGELEMPGFLLDHLQATNRPALWSRLKKAGPMEPDVEQLLVEAIVEASGLAADFRNVEAILRRFKDPRNDLAKLRRYWLNELVKGANAWLNPDDWAAIANARRHVGRREQIVLGFDGSLYDDATALIGCTADGFLFVVKIWAKPEGAAGRLWQVDTADVDRTLRQAMRDHDVALVYADQHYWKDYVDAWAGEYGPERIVKYDTRQYERHSRSCEALETAVHDKHASHDGHELLRAHVENARKFFIGSEQRRRTEERPPYVLVKEHKKSDRKIDAAVAAVLAWAARGHAIERRLFKTRPRGGLRFH